MDNNENLLEILCRLCGTTIKVNDKYILKNEVNQHTHVHPWNQSTLWVWC